MNRLREQNPEAEKLLNLCAFIGRTLFLSAC